MLNKPEIKYIIAIASGKGGVGKSTTAVNLALALSNKKLKVGLLDADIYGPNQPQMLGVSLQKPQSHDGKTFEPMIAHGIESMSIGYLIDRDTPMIWRGPIATNALQRLFNDTRWSTLDFLIIDLPPGTGDIQLTLAQKIPMTGVVIVTTPQEVALLDIRKAINMFVKVKIPIVGIVENMSSYICSQCGHEEEIFGSGGGLQIAQEFQCTLLGSLPLGKKIRECSDQGQPIVVSDPTHPVTIAYHKIAQALIDQINHLPRNPFPKIVIEN